MMTTAIRLMVKKHIMRLPSVIIKPKIYKAILLCIYLLVNAQLTFGQNERFFVGSEAGLIAPRSFHLPDSDYPDYFYLNTFSYEEFAGLHLMYLLNSNFRFSVGYNYFSFTTSYSLGGNPQNRFLKNRGMATGYTMHHFPLLFSYHLPVKEHKKYRIILLPKAGLVYSRTENVDLNAGSITTIINGDTLGSNDESGVLLTRNNFLPKIGIGLEIEYYNRRNKTRKIQINAGYAFGTRKLHVFYLGSEDELTKISSRGSFFDLSVSYFIPVADLIPKKKRIAIQSQYTDSKLYRILYLP